MAIQPKTDSQPIIAMVIAVKYTMLVSLCLNVAGLTAGSLLCIKAEWPSMVPLPSSRMVVGVPTVVNRFNTTVTAHAFVNPGSWLAKREAAGRPGQPNPEALPSDELRGVLHPVSGSAPKVLY